MSTPDPVPPTVEERLKALEETIAHLAAATIVGGKSEVQKLIDWVKKYL